MKSKLIGGAVFALLINASAASAAPSFLEDRMAGWNKQQAKLNAPKSFQNKKIEPPVINKMNGDPNKLVCESGKCVDSSYQEILPEDSPRQASVNFYGSMTGFESGMNAKVHVDATVQEYLKGELTLAYITMGLTEPAVAAGLAQAVNYIGHDVNNRLQSEQAFFNQLAYMPEVSETLGQAYINCIANKQANGENWMAAQAKCTGDTAKLSTNKKKFEDDSGGISQLTYKDDPFHEGSSDEVIYLTDYLFRKANGGASSGPLDEFRQSFKKLIGDVKYEFEKLTSGSGTADKQGVRRLTYNREKPQMAFDDFLTQEAKAVHQTLLKAFKEACDFEANPPASNPSTAMDGDAFLRNIGTWLDQLTYPGFAPDSTLMRELWELAPERDNNICPQYETIYKWETVTANPNTAPEAARDYVNLSRGIAFGRTYGIFILAEQYLRNLNAGEFDAFARQAGFELLYFASGTENMASVYKIHTRNLRTYIDDLAVRTAKRKQFNQAKGVPAGGGNGNAGSQQTGGSGSGMSGSL